MSTQNIGIKLILDGKEYEATLNTLKAKTKDYTTQATGIDRVSGSWSKLTTVSLATAGALGTVVGVYKAFLKPAMDAEEAASKFNTIFGEQAQAVRAWADAYGEQIGRSSRVLQGFSADMMAIVSPLGVTRDAALNMSQGLTQAAQDIASFHNVDVSEAFNALRAGITGETEPLKRFSILLTDAAMQEYALANGIRKKVSEMTTAEKTTLRYNVILASLGHAQDDATRTANSTTNQLRRFQDQISDLQVAIGSKLLPALGSTLSFFVDNESALNRYSRANQEAGEQIIRVASALAQMTWREASDQASDFASNFDVVAEILDVVAEKLGVVATATSDWISQSGAIDGFKTIFNGIGDGIGWVGEQASRVDLSNVVNGQFIVDANNAAQAVQNVNNNLNNTQQATQQANGALVALSMTGYNAILQSLHQVEQQQTAQQTRSQQAAQAWASQHKSLLQGLQGTWANYYTTIGSHEQAQLATLTQSTQQQVTQWQQLQRHRLVTAQQAADAIANIQSETEDRRNRIAQHGVQYRQALEVQGATTVRNIQSQVAQSVADTMQMYNDNLQYLHDTGMYNATEFAYYQISAADMVAVQQAQIWQQQTSTYYQALRARMGMESRGYKFSASIAQAGAVLMNSNNEALFKVGQAASIANTFMSTAEGIMKGYAMFGPILGSVFAGVVGTAGALQIAQITKQKPPEKSNVTVPSPPSFAVGAWQLPSDITGATLHKDEMVLPKPFAEEYRKNVSGDGSIGNTYNITVQGSVIDKDGFLNSVGESIERIQRQSGQRIMR